MLIIIFWVKVSYNDEKKFTYKQEEVGDLKQNQRVETQAFVNLTIRDKKGKLEKQGQNWN